jgi:hypothetical protein
MKGELVPPGFAPTGRRIEVCGDDHWEFRGGLLCRCEVLYDLNAVGVQIGAAPAPGTRGEKFAVLRQRLAASRMRRRGDALDPWRRTEARAGHTTGPKSSQGTVHPLP